MNKVTDSNFESIIYISHPSGGLQENADAVAEKIKQLRKAYPKYLFLSPIHAFGMLYNEVGYETGILCCLWLLEKADEMWVFGNFSNSKGCNIEIEYCKEHGIPFRILGDV